MVSVSVETPLPEVKVVRHARARNLRLRVEPTGIRLTVPLFCTKRQIQQFLNQSEPWLWLHGRSNNSNCFKHPLFLSNWYYSPILNHSPL